MLDFFISNINRSVISSKLQIVWYSIRLGYYTHYYNNNYYIKPNIGLWMSLNMT